MRRCVAVLVALVPAVASAGDWPMFRGPNGQGTSDDPNPPLTWSATENVAWKQSVSGDGWSSPIVHGGKVFVTTSTDSGQSCRVLAFAAADGKPLWDVEVFRQKTLRKEGRNSYATPTPATDGERVYAVFNDGSIAAVTADGKPVWTHREVKYYSQHGLGGSPVLYRGLVVMAFDGSSDGPDKGVGWHKPWDKAVLLALDASSGKEKWRASRGLSRIGHATPIVTNVGGKDVLVSPAGDVIQGFDPATGERLWSVRAEGEGLVPSPVAGGGLVFAMPGFGAPALRAVKLAGGGDAREVVWSLKKNVPMMPSAVYAEPHLFTVSEKGVAMCLDAATGAVKWEERLPGAYSASPVLAAGRVYYLSDAGETTVVAVKPAFEKLAANKLNEPCQASPAVAGGRLYVRTKSNLYAIGK